jgi:hypothetical protein
MGARSHQAGNRGRDVSAATYCIGTWDTERQAFTQHPGLPWYGLTRRELVAIMRELQQCGYTCHRVRYRDPDGTLTDEADSDVSVLIERTDGRTQQQVREDWQR